MIDKERSKRLKKAIREMGFSITGITQLLKISRGTFYNRLANPSDKFLMDIRRVTNNRLENYFPEVRGYVEKNSNELDGEQYQKRLKNITELKYYQLLEDCNNLSRTHTHLLKFLVKIANNNASDELKEEINEFIDESNRIG